MNPVSSTLLASSAAIALSTAPRPPIRTKPVEPIASAVARVSHHPAKHTGGHERRQPPRPIAAPVHDLVTANRHAMREPTNQGFIDAVQVYPYAEGAVYHVYTAPGRITDVALQPGEVLSAVASGDTVRWVIGDTPSGSGDDRRSHVLVKPFAAGLATSLVITTDRHVYHLALTSTPRAAMVAVSWTYPQDGLIAIHRVTETAQAVARSAIGLDLDQLHFNYRLSGDTPEWRPLRAFDDGHQTFIEFPASIATGEAPPLFVVGPKGEAQLVNYRMQGRYYVVDRLFDVAELRLGVKRQQVVRISRVTDASGTRGRS